MTSYRDSEDLGGRSRIVLGIEGILHGQHCKKTHKTKLFCQFRRYKSYILASNYMLSKNYTIPDPTCT